MAKSSVKKDKFKKIVTSRKQILIKKAKKKPVIKFNKNQPKSSIPDNMNFDLLFPKLIKAIN